MHSTYSSALVIGASGTIGVQVVREAEAFGLRAIPASRHTRQGMTRIATNQELDHAVAEADFVIMTHGGDSDPQAALHTVARTIDAAKRHGRPVALMTSMGVTHPSGWSTSLLTTKFEGEELLRSSGLHYVIVRPGWFGYQSPTDTRPDLRQGDLVVGQVGVDPRHVAQALLHGIISTTDNHTIEVFSTSGPALDWSQAWSSLDAD